MFVLCQIVSLLLGYPFPEISNSIYFKDMTIRLSTTNESIIDAVENEAGFVFFASSCVFIGSQYDTLMYLRSAYHITTIL
jgi:hypothetical protein